MTLDFSADIRYADILQLLWPIIDTNIYVYFFPTCRDHRVSSVMEFTHNIVMHTLTVLARWQMQA